MRLTSALILALTLSPILVRESSASFRFTLWDLLPRRAERATPVQRPRELTEPERLRKSAKRMIDLLRTRVADFENLGLDLDDPGSLQSVSFGLPPLPQVYLAAALSELRALEQLSPGQKLDEGSRGLVAALAEATRAGDGRLSGRYVTEAALAEINRMGETAFELTGSPEFEYPSRPARKRRAPPEAHSLANAMGRLKLSVQQVAHSTGALREIEAEGARILEAIADLEVSASAAAAQRSLKDRIAHYILAVYQVSLLLEASGDTATRVMPSGVERAIAPFISEGQRILLARVKRVETAR
jgi:hypothetical protein